MLTLTIPQSEPSAARNRSASRWSRVKMLEDRPWGTPLWSAIASSTVRVGHHVQDRGERLAADDVGLGGHSDERRLDVVGIGGAGDGAAPTADDNHATVGPGLARAHRPSTVRALVDQRTDERPVGGWVADRKAREHVAQPGDKLVRDSDSCAITRRRLVHRCPAVPAAANTIPRVASSRSADGATTAALLPPSSSRHRPRRAATRGATSAPIRSDPVALTSATSGLSISAAPATASAITSWCSPTGAPASAHGAVQHRGARHRRQRRHRRGLPNDAVAAHQRDRGVPGPHGRREVERGDHGHHPERVPGLHQPVARALGGHRATLELAREPDREVADVDHLLDLAERLGRDLARLDRDQLGDVGLVLAEQGAEPLDERAASGCGHHAPGAERSLGRGDRRRDLCLSGRGNLEQVLAGDRRARHHGRPRQQHRSGAAALEAAPGAVPARRSTETDSAVELMALVAPGTTVATWSGVASVPLGRSASRALAADRARSSCSNSGPKPSIVVAGTPNDAASARSPVARGRPRTAPRPTAPGRSAACRSRHPRRARSSAGYAPATAVASSPQAYMKPPSPTTHTVGPAPARPAPSDAGNPNPSVPQPSGYASLRGCGTCQ